MAQGIVSLLDKPHFARVTELWREIQEQFGVGEPEAKAMPHISYHVAEKYEAEPLREILKEAASRQRPFTITATGIGIFPGQEPAVYIPVARNQELTTLHAWLWPRLTAISERPIAYYAPDYWFPHITLGHADVTLEKWAPVITWLHQQQINWTITLDNFHVLTEEGSDHVEMLREMFVR